MRRLTACQECWDHWIACMYDGTTILLLFRGATGERKIPNNCFGSCGRSRSMVLVHYIWVAGSCNDINILDASPLHKCFVDGTHSCIDFDYAIDNDHVFSKPYYLVDGIYPTLTHFVKTISVPISPKEKAFAAWQEAACIDVEHGFGVFA